MRFSMNNLGLRQLNAILRGTRAAENPNYRGRWQRPWNKTEGVVGNAVGYDGSALSAGQTQNTRSRTALCAVQPVEPTGDQVVGRTSKSAVSQVSKPASRSSSDDLPIWKSAIQQVWKPALRPLQRIPRSLSSSQRLLTSSPTGSTSGFTMMEIAISLAVIGIALVAIIGVLPIGMNVQQSNRQETIIGQDANVLMEAIRNGSVGSDDLTNYVYAVSNFWGMYAPVSSGGGVEKTGVNGYTYSSSSVDSQYIFREGALNVSHAWITNGANIIGLLSTPEYIGAIGDSGGDAPGQPIPSLYFGGISNHIVAYCYSISGPAIQKPPQDNPILQQDSFGYHLYCVNAPTPVDTNLFFEGFGPWKDTATYGQGNTVFFNWTYWTCSSGPAQGPVPGNSTVWQMTPNYTLEMALNLHELRLTFEWPKLGNGGVGSGRETFRTMVAGQLERQQIMNPTISAADTIWYNSNLWCYLPETFTNTP
jgi:type II secretory pathway pseudopilin PulG